MFKNAKIRTKTITAFGGVIVVSIIVIVVLLIAMNRIADMTQAIYEKPYTETNSMWSMRRDLLNTQNTLNKLISADEDQLKAEVNSAKQIFSSDDTSLNTTIEKLNTLLIEQEELNILNQIQTEVKEHQVLRDEIVQLIVDGEIDQAKNLMKIDYTESFSTISNDVLSLFQIVSDEAETFVSQSQKISRNSVLFGVILLIIGIIVANAIATIFTRSLVTPIHQLTLAANEMTKGNLKVVEKVTYQSKDEMGQLADSLRFTMTTLSQYVDEISSVLLLISKGDLTVPYQQITDFKGDFATIKSSLVQILKSFNITLGEINRSAEQVDTGSGQIAAAAQGLSEGSSQQANAIERLANAIEEISEQVRENANNASEASKKALEAGQEMELGSQQVGKMATAMDEINHATSEIGKIIKTIEDIAFQTNILALNAAVEAARAGAAGKGFAVVADEVRNLASKSGTASKNTAALIENTIHAVQNGIEISNETAKSILTVMETAKQVNGYVDRICEASNQQAASIEEVTHSVEQISSVVQNNSASAQESAAASEELTTQADLLRILVQKFHLFK